ncbi:hypothetical protein [Microbulbifer epialgicus]|uniref:Uncharacterized protein n=1 Tax=Microbulbifer epialgicus TaxID=393907 RepID=A0ABV4NYX7_9GAMM
MRAFGAPVPGAIADFPKIETVTIPDLLVGKYTAAFAIQKIEKLEFQCGKTYTIYSRPY